MVKKILLVAIITLFVYSCSNSSDTPEPTPPSQKFNRGTVLKNYADNNIIPAFQNFKNKLATLKDNADAFKASTSQSTLNSLRTSWYDAYKAWQTVAMFNIGKAEEIQFVNHFNIYPLNVVDVENNITNGNYDLNHPNNHDAQGFPALDYLLYGLADNDTNIIAKFSTDAKADKYKKYLTDVVAKMNTVTAQIVADWTGGYKSTFIASTDNTATSSLNKLVNDFIFYYEKQLRANKIGIPAGNFSSTALPNKVEALYRKNISKELALEALNSFQNFFEGKSFDGKSTGESFKSYLIALKRQDLVTEITNQLGKAKSAVNDLDANFYNQITTDNTKMTKAYDELQKVIRFLKVDMLQAFNVSVDYVDADGD